MADLNIFKDAYLGKAYTTRDGRKAIYVECFKNVYGNTAHRLISKGLFGYRNVNTMADGNIFKGRMDKDDIVSEWHEEISEEELDEAFNDYIVNERAKCGNDKDVCEVISTDNVWLKEGFKAGFHKAMEGK